MDENLGKKKKQALRNNEYYDMQSVFDGLYDKSRKNAKFNKLMELIVCENNILLAYRNIKNNKGSKTKGTDGLDIRYYEKFSKMKIVELIQKKFADYKPKSVLRVEIPKNNGKTRHLGIPCMIDRIMQQCIKQIIEPICEAKFNEYSYGFRPNRSTNHALARCMHMINRSGLHYTVDIDIKGFFDNVNHAKLKKQIWNLSIQDKNLLCVISKILKSEISGLGIPSKGTPQGGIISPLLSNIVLNELDWWLHSQYDGLKTRSKLSGSYKRYALEKTNIKMIKFVRYADDFKIFCKDYKTAEMIFIATKMWLKERLGLDISPTKSKIINTRKRSSEFLGFRLKAVPKRKTYVCHSSMRVETRQKIVDNFKRQIRIIQKSNNTRDIRKLNAMIVGCHNYYKCASHISTDFQRISFLVYKTLDIRLRDRLSNKPKFNKTYERLYGSYKGKPRVISGITFFPIYGCKNVPPMQFVKKICNYTEQGRKLIHDKIGGYTNIIEYLLETMNDHSIAFNDNRISLIAGQNGKCGVTGKKLNKYNMECHHKLPKHMGGEDDYKNLIWVAADIHKLIHSSQLETIEKYKSIVDLDYKGLKKINSLRKLVKNTVI